MRAWDRAAGLSRTARAAAIAALVALAGCASNGSRDATVPGVRIYEEGGRAVVESDRACFAFDLAAGTFGFEDRTQPFVAARGLVAGARAPAASTDAGYRFAWTAAPGRDPEGPPGAARALVVTAMPDGAPGDPRPVLTLRATMSAGAGRIFLDLAATNATDAPMAVSGLATAAIPPARTGRVRVGGRLSDLRVLHNGSDLFVDFHVHIVPGTQRPLNLLEGLLRGTSSTANYSVAFHDLAEGTGAVIGYTTFARSTPTVATGWTGAGDETEGFDVFSADTLFLAPKVLAPGESVEAERLRIGLGEPTTFDALESWAEAVKAENEIALWTERRPGNRVPNGWNSWSGSSSTGGYGTDIDEAVILDNLAFAREHLRPWGMDWFQVDDGWERVEGDWEPRPDRFPRGMKWLADEIRAAGFRPGLWISAFVADEGSALVGERPELIARKSPIGELAVPSNWEILDLSNPATTDWLGALFGRITREWGYEWVKFDFGYWAMFGADVFDPTLTPHEVYRRGLETIRSAIGPDVFFLSVALLGPNFGVADAMRLTLDTLPSWEAERGVPYAIDGQGIKPTYRSAARRYYLHDRIWINHNDLIFFRAHADPEVPALAWEESLCQLTMIGMFGGIVKIGEKLVEMTDAQVEAVGKLLPVWGRSARPVDLFEREYPEVLHLPVETARERYDVVSLIHWGENRDLADATFPVMAEAPREIGVDLARIGLDPDAEYVAYEFWSERYLGKVRGRLGAILAPRRAMAVALRPVPNHPWLAGSNRHLLQGATDVTAMDWNERARRLAITVRAVPGFRHHVALYVPEGYLFAGAHAAGGAVRARFEAPIVHLEFQESAPPADLTIEARFE